ncbi:hypothetical protein M8C21_025346 [Ambrosia artemisiifolia]|uniref:Uncharacterized protein n=1 Tax=Ambrosia artemisiifolia TaxID=4212 RepID=A0AAD5BXT9_AMBAR|nr:hypothetical protein M8C21_025346 [Ambrosia artemisiifolia]
MEQVFGSESSSGCESGWTLYLEHSHNNEDDLVCKHASFSYKEEEDDMSMVSDASSGPQQHFPEQEDEYNNNNSNNYNGGTASYTNGKRQKNISKESKKTPAPPFLDDTASSPLFNLSNNNLTLPNNASNEIVDYSQGYSTTYFKGKSAFEEHLGFFHSVTGAQLQQNQWLEGKRWA